MAESSKKLLERVRDSDQRTKKKYVVVFSAVAMVIVVAFWIIYINTIIQPAESPSRESKFWPVFKNGLRITYYSLKNKLNEFSLGSLGGKSITIER